ncbi:unnamed protein product [Zymoseptoria tritici ST99CH_3D7]|uniref:Uncharacterized protein n=1 Tax=Zymoseptoria tritici (strain ST99CH_3D7) TaxID=1276538 RepID=A0A1X7S9L1_ZYMT9|nr:unnamed protein product [Zymoseptoria tritici ST99CH_3D7]
MANVIDLTGDDENEKSRAGLPLPTKPGFVKRSSNMESRSPQDQVPRVKSLNHASNKEQWIHSGFPIYRHSTFWNSSHHLCRLCIMRCMPCDAISPDADEDVTDNSMLNDKLFDGMTMDTTLPVHCSSGSPYLLEHRYLRR